MDLSHGLIKPSTLYYGDCLEVMERWSPGQADLIYLDPPFNSKTDYNILFGTKSDEKSAQFLAFQDTWQWDDDAAQSVQEFKDAAGNPAYKVIRGLAEILGESGMLAYLVYMAKRLIPIRQVLKPTGSIYLHCDPTASHYLKLLMDAIFGARNFRNEIVWCYTGPSNTKRWWPRKHDVLLFYAGRTGGESWIFNSDTVKIPYVKLKTGKTKGIFKKEATLSEKGKVPEDYWLEDRDGMTPVGRIKSERLGYPTQKPVALLERIIKASSKPGDLVLDPFCGCGTTVVAAHNTGRQWAGIDISVFAVENVMRLRLSKFGVQCSTDGIPMDLASAEYMVKQKEYGAFETWAINKVDGMVPNTKQVGDRGLDGRGTLLSKVAGYEGKVVLAQVKSGKPTMDNVRAFRQVLDREGAVAGVFITLKRNWTRGMEKEFQAGGWFSPEGAATKYPCLQFWSIEDYFENNTRPNLPPLANPYTGKPMQRTLYEQPAKTNG